MMTLTQQVFLKRAIELAETIDCYDKTACEEIRQMLLQNAINQAKKILKISNNPNFKQY